MPIQWTQRARRQFLAIIDAVLEDNPSSAEHVYDAIMDSVARLVTFPEMGRRQVPGTRELVIASSGTLSPTVSGGRLSISLPSCTVRRSGPNGSKQHSRRVRQPLPQWDSTALLGPRLCVFFPCTVWKRDDPGRRASGLAV